MRVSMMQFEGLCILEVRLMEVGLRMTAPAGVEKRLACLTRPDRGTVQPLCDRSWKRHWCSKLPTQFFDDIPPSDTK